MLFTNKKYSFVILEVIICKNYFANLHSLMLVNIIESVTKLMQLVYHLNAFYARISLLNDLTSSSTVITFRYSRLQIHSVLLSVNEILLTIAAPIFRINIDTAASVSEG